MITISVTTPWIPPTWALWQRHLIDSMNRAALEFVERYTRSDGTLIWRDEWPGMDGSDDGYESFHNFALFYALGGSQEVHQLARREWDAITWQFTQYGQVHREFDAYYDWMHHGESSVYFYYYGLADPTVLKDRQRALRFAHMYTGEDPEAPNYDPERKLIRSPINGSRGPRLQMSAEDWITHRPVLAHYPPPFEDIPGVQGPTADWNDDATFAQILRLMNERMAQGDVPLNLTATSLVTHAYLYTGEEKYRRWVLEYLRAWKERTEANGGILPDNVGLSGRIGECMDGKWWGGYYGWRWPHGAMNLLESSLIAGCNAAMLTGDLSHLDLARSQIDLLWSLGREEDGVWKVPHRHKDDGWQDYRPLDPRYVIHLWNLSQAEEDLERIRRYGTREEWDRIADTVGKGDQAHAAPWYRYLEGCLPDYPERILQVSWRQHCLRLQRMREELWTPQEWDVHHWQDLNPVICEGLLQTMLGAPAPIYHGGLLHCRVRYHDAARQRPGLPEDVAALVEALDGRGIALQLGNLNAHQAREVIVQAGAFGEHRFGAVRVGDSEQEIGSPWLHVVLAPGAGAGLRLDMQRYVNVPSYRTPWAEEEPSLLRGRASA